MKFFADENVARAIVIWMRTNGHDVLFASEAQPGTADSEWLRLAENEKRLIITSDKDFGELVFRDRLNSHGIVLMRLDTLPISQRLARLQECWSIIEANPSGKFIVVTEKKVRVRPLAINGEKPIGEP
jgi:predicted nuclease of predicted toxin-antitoxin system